MAADPVWEMTSQTWTSRAEDRDTSEVQVTSRHLSDEQQSASAWMLVNELACQKRASARWLVLAGETLLEVQQRLLKEREMKIRSALEKLRKKRHLLRAQRKHKEFPIVSVLGYTNCGERVETVLAQLLNIQGFSLTTMNTILLFSFPSSAQEKRLWSKRWLVTVVFNPETSFSPPWMSPFMQASCPVTWRFCTWTPSASCRSCRTSSLTPSLPPWKISNTQYVSDAGVLDETQAIWQRKQLSFRVQLLTRLSSFLYLQDLLVHVRDISHPETVNQKVNVLNVLKNLQIPDGLLSSMIEVHNKIDLIDK